MFLSHNFSRTLFPFSRTQMLFEADNGANATTGTNGSQPSPEPAATQPAAQNQPATPQPSKKPNIDRATQRAIDDTLARHGDDSNAALATLTRQIHRLEESIGTSETDVTELAQYRTLGKVSELQTKLGERDTWGTERANTAKTSALQKAATAPKTALNATLLASLAGALDVDYLTEGEGENATGYVRYKENGAEVKKLLTEHVAQKYPALVEQLKATPTPAARKVKPYGKSAPVGGGERQSKAEEIRQEQRKKRSISEDGGENGSAKTTIFRRRG